MSLQTLRTALTKPTYGACTVNKQLGLLALGLLGVLLAAGQPGEAAPSPGPNDIQDSLPAWNADGVYVAFERTTRTFAHVLAMTSSGNDTLVVSFAGRVRGYLGSRVLVQ